MTSRRGPSGVPTAFVAALLLVLAGCGVDAEVREARGDGVAGLPTATATADGDAALGLEPMTVPPTTTTAPPATSDPGGGGSGGGGGGGSSTVVLAGQAPSRLSFGMHVQQTDQSAWPSVPVGAYRILNADSVWGALEPAPGQWDFRRLDARVDAARARGGTVLLVLSHPPTWASSRPELVAFGGSPAPPRSTEEWRTYVRTVVSRYAGRIEGYEIWNEPNLPQFFSGSPQQLADLTRTASEVIRATDPGALVVSGGFSARTGGAESYFRSFVGSGIASAVDVVGIHIYPYPGQGPEAMVDLTRRFRAIADGAGLGSKPMWNTEIGYGRTPDAVIGDEAAASLVLRTYLVLPAAGLHRNYWYKWDDREFVGLYLVGSDRRTPTASAYRYADAQRWLVNGSLDRCTSSGGPWTCTLQHADGPTVTIAWSLDGTVDYRVPDGAAVAYTFGGGSSGVSPGGSIRLGATPVLLAPSPLPSLG